MWTEAFEDQKKNYLLLLFSNPFEAVMFELCPHGTENIIEISNIFMVMY